MGYKRSFDDKEIQRLPPCMNLRSKAIYVTGDPDPQSPEQEGSTRFNCWCNKTQHVVGPDQEIVERTACVDGRGCYQPRVAFRRGEDRKNSGLCESRTCLRRAFEI